MSDLEELMKESQSGAKVETGNELEKYVQCISKIKGLITDLHEKKD